MARGENKGKPGSPGWQPTDRTKDSGKTPPVVTPMLYIDPDAGPQAGPALQKALIELITTPLGGIDAQHEAFTKLTTIEVASNDGEYVTRNDDGEITSVLNAWRNGPGQQHSWDMSTAITSTNPDELRELAEWSKNPVVRSLAQRNSNNPNAVTPPIYEGSLHTTDVLDQAYNLGVLIGNDSGGEIVDLLPGDDGYNYAMSDRGVFLQDADSVEGLRTITLTPGTDEVGNEEWQVTFHHIETNGAQRAFREPLGTTWNDRGKTITPQQAAQILARNIIDDYPYLDRDSRSDYTRLREEDCLALENVITTVEYNEFAGDIF